MKKLLPLFYINIIYLISCTNIDTTTAKEENDSSKQTTVITAQKPAAETICYASRTATDTVLLNIKNKMGEVVTGSLLVKYSGKDANNGMLSGTMQGDTLIADYNFQSEGIQSVRQVVFLKKDNGFVQGYGDVEERGGKTVFKNRGLLNFNEKMFLPKVPCTQ